ncbi:hypothetical protein GUITHDRAFT_119979 [Guillardia theta CCMP2712]|uniref:Uncharacterized protein n=1 Tax=Guillardia theta (strain CCMP2712) TaxID=905079 RepID=L1IC72_GUITC|nr:hypothetical protein GUITHDRAFT_119979 [Guillardia theta CCMP2712]EKX33808.1 hypothetical protein GUITHDRAFT_119979 [Guillardia theta CCMP2712]|eukprot:XP_005820788.1 hypothetical protein GUITHDRAFT_119979 [Guillardia theta CCMP2712]
MYSSQNSLNISDLASRTQAAEDLRKLHDDCVVAEGVKSLAIKGYLQFIDFFSETRRLCNIHRTSILHFQQERKLAEKRTADVFFESFEDSVMASLASSRSDLSSSDDWQHLSGVWRKKDELSGLSEVTRMFNSPKLLADVPNLIVQLVSEHVEDIKAILLALRRREVGKYPRNVRRLIVSSKMIQLEVMKLTNVSPAGELNTSGFMSTNGSASIQV